LKLKCPDCLPGSVHIYLEELPLSEKSGSNYRLFEKHRGELLLNKMAFDSFGIENLNIQRKPGQKPFAVKRDGNELFLGLSHSQKLIAGVLSVKYPVAIDIENVERNINRGLLHRIKHHDEPEKIYEKYELLRMWTIKESALKWRGTGLRIRMNSLRICELDKNLFEAIYIDRIKVKVCSFKETGHWISVAYG